jgi:hypothetical protein
MDYQQADDGSAFEAPSLFSADEAATLRSI